MILLAKIFGFLLIVFAVVSFLSVIPSYRAFKSEETRFFLTPNDVDLPNEIDEDDIVESATPIDTAQFFRTFFLPPIVLLILGIALIVLAFCLRSPVASPPSKG